MKINFTKKQYEALAKSVYLGNWMANAHRTGQKGDLRLEEYSDISDYVFSLAPELGFSKNFEHDLECGENHKENTEVSRLHEEYDEETSWDELSSWLGERDFFIKYTSKEIEAMDDEERFTKRMECEIVWEQEFEKYGVDRLRVEETKE